MRDIVDFEHDTPQRAMGSETEYNVQKLPDTLNLQPFVQEAHWRELSRDDGKELWLENGSRLYVDSGGVIEYATGEVISAKDLVRHERAGEGIVQDMADRMNGGPAPVYKRSGYANVFVDKKLQIEQTTAGHHENYLTPIRSGIPGGYEGHYNDRSLQTYLSTRAIWAGAGIVGPHGFALSQKLDTIDFGIYTKRSGTGKKAPYVINSSQRSKAHRLEIRLGDGNMSEWAIRSKFAFTSLVLRLVEHGEFPKYLHLKSSATDAFNSTLYNQPVQTVGHPMSPATHQRLIAEAALSFAEDRDIPDEEIKAALEIIEICHIIDSMDTDLSDPLQLASQVDWAAKKVYLRSKGITDLSSGNLRAVMFDLEWENISKSGNAREWYSEHGADDLVPPSQIEEARVLPPATRALARTSLLASFADYPHAIDWERIKFSGRIYRLDDPYDFSQSG